MKLLKLGSLSLQNDKWLDALDTFDEITVIKGLESEEEVQGLKYHEFNENSFVKRWFIRIIKHFNEDKKYEKLEDFILLIFRLFVRKDIKALKSMNYDEVYVAYNDFDESALLLILFKPYIKKGVRITRAYKESRPNYKYLEKRAFEMADRVILNAPENVVFFKEKYGKSFFNGKDIITDVDEDVLGSKYINGIIYQKKLSSLDGNKHLVILASKVFSDNLDIRSGSRLFYIPLIKECIEAGLIVHLHTLRIMPDNNGIDQYELLKNEYPNSFFIEQPLNFNGNGWKDAYSTLSRYDYGILHNFVEGTSNSEFDKYNIPHRYYEYLLAHVTPVLLKNKTLVMQRIMEEKRTGVLYTAIHELLDSHKVYYETTSFSEYIKGIYK